MSGESAGTAMRPIRKTIPIEEALRVIREAARPLDRTVQVGLPDAAGRVLAADIVAERDVPPFDRAAMDGYAVVASDTFGAGRQDPARLRCIESVHTGMVAARRLGAGECIQIATGAPLPRRGRRGRHGRADGARWRGGPGPRARPPAPARRPAGGRHRRGPDPAARGRSC